MNQFQVCCAIPSPYLVSVSPLRVLRGYQLNPKNLLRAAQINLDPLFRTIPGIPDSSGSPSNALSGRSSTVEAEAVINSSFPVLVLPVFSTEAGQGAFSPQYSALPPIIVINTWMSGTSSIGITRGSAERISRSATFPGVNCLLFLLPWSRKHH